MKTTLYTSITNNIGQVKEANAQKEIDRLNRQENTNKWRKDYSDEMFVDDETEEEVDNPLIRSEGFVFVTCESK